MEYKNVNFTKRLGTKAITLLLGGALLATSCGKEASKNPSLEKGEEIAKTIIKDALGSWRFEHQELTSTTLYNTIESKGTEGGNPAGTITGKLADMPEAEKIFKGIVRVGGTSAGKEIPTGALAKFLCEDFDARTKGEHIAAAHSLLACSEAIVAATADSKKYEPKKVDEVLTNFEQALKKADELEVDGTSKKLKVKTAGTKDLLAVAEIKKGFEDFKASVLAAKEKYEAVIEVTKK